MQQIDRKDKKDYCPSFFTVTFCESY